MELEIFRDGKKYIVELKNGEAKAHLKIVGKSKDSGTEITFLPSKEIFSSIKFNGSILIKRMRELAFLNKGIKITFSNGLNTKQKNKEFSYEGVV